MKPAAAFVFLVVEFQIYMNCLYAFVTHGHAPFSLSSGHGLCVWEGGFLAENEAITSSGCLAQLGPTAADDTHLLFSHSHINIHSKHCLPRKSAPSSSLED